MDYKCDLLLLLLVVGVVVLFNICFTLTLLRFFPVLCYLSFPKSNVLRITIIPNFTNEITEG